MHNNPITIIIAEDQMMNAEGIAAVLEKSGRFKVLGISPNGEHLLHCLNNVQPDLVLLDLNMPVMDGLTACKLIKQRFPEIKVVALTMYNHHKTQKELQQAGAAGMILKFESAEVLIATLEEIINAESDNRFVTSGVYPDNVVPELVNRQDDFLTQYKISKREFEIIQFIAKGSNTEDIAEKLCLSTYTITTHRRNILNKLDINNAAELVNLMHQKGLL